MPEEAVRVQVAGLEQETRVSVEFPCCFPPPSLSSIAAGAISSPEQVSLV